MVTPWFLVVNHSFGAEGVLQLAVWRRLVLAVGVCFTRALRWGLRSALQRVVVRWLLDQGSMVGLGCAA